MAKPRTAKTRTETPASPSDPGRAAAPAPAGPYARWFGAERRPIEAAIRKSLPRAGAVPLSLREAMSYALFPGGKRIRPALVLLGHRAGGGRHGDVYAVAACSELVHTFSLIHDDLPCMDDDDLRRGRPTCHRVYGEALAVLAGDALLNRAYEILSEIDCEPGRRSAILSCLASAMGGSGVLGGQTEDIEAEGKEITERELERIHRRKTASLIAACLRMGSLLAGAKPDAVRAIDRFGEALGLLFQITDDLLNIEGSEVQLGRPAGGDARLAKATYPRVVGIDGARKRARLIAARAERSAPETAPWREIYRDLVCVVAGRVDLRGK